MAKENSEGKRPSSLPDGISSIADDEAITEIDFNSFLEESSDDSSVFAGFHDDIEQTEKNLADELDSLYDDIMSSGPATIVPKPISAIVSGSEVSTLTNTLSARIPFLIAASATTSAISP